MNKSMDPMGRAIADYHKTGAADRLSVFSPMFEEDEIPLSTLFRKYEDMPEIEQTALDMAKGKTLDVGAGAGCHSLFLQERGVDVTAIDISPLSVATMKERGIKHVIEQDFFTLKGQYDTILMLMNGIGIVGTLDRLPVFFRLSPQVGYMLNDKFGIYADVNFDSYKGALTNDKALSSFGFDVAARYIFAKSGIASFFIDGGVGMNFFNKSRGNVMGIVFVPGIKIAASEKVELVARLGGIGARFGNKKAQESGAAPKSEYGLNVQNSAISFGVAYNF